MFILSQFSLNKQYERGKKTDTKLTLLHIGKMFITYS